VIKQWDKYSQLCVQRQILNQIKSNHLFRQADTKKNVDKMSNEKA